jgi:hypothetical protein
LRGAGGILKHNLSSLKRFDSSAKEMSIKNWSASFACSIISKQSLHSQFNKLISITNAELPKI